MALLALAPATAHAGMVTWGSQFEACGGFNGSERGSGQLDAAGRLYVPCSRSLRNGQLVHDNYVAVYGPGGQRVSTIPMRFPGKAGTDRVSDVAPSPDGSFLYVIHYAEYRAYRFDRQPDGSYVARSQAEWSLAPYPHRFGGWARPLGQFLSTDGHGDIYFSSGLWACNVECTDDAVVKYRPDGAFLTRFGRKSGGSWALGDAHGSFGGVAVTADGRRAFVTDINNSRVQRFDRQGDGSYQPVLSMGMNAQSDPNRWGACFGDGRLAGAYDVALSARGEVMVINTTCHAQQGFHDYMPYGTIEVQRFGQDASLRGSIVASTCSTNHAGVRECGDTRVHGIAVDRSGNVHLVQGKVVVRPAAGWSDAGADAGGGGPMGGAAALDSTAPVITSLTAPATTVDARITVGIAATDAVGVTELRIREDGVQGGWQPYATAVAHSLTDRLGGHVLEVEVRDAAGNVSAVRAITVTKVAPPTQPAPAPAPTPTNPTQPTQPANAAPTVEPAPVQPAQPANPAGPTVVAGGGGPVQPKPFDPAVAPTIIRATIPAQVFRGRRIGVTVSARAKVGRVTAVRFSTVGRWSTWQPVRGRRSVLLPAGVGWGGVLVQVRDSAGNRSVPLFQPVLRGPRGTSWAKGTGRADALRLGRGSQHVDLSSFDGAVDRVSCGSGYDTVYAQPEDEVAADCERVVRVRMPAW